MSYDRKQAARELMSNPLLPDLFAEIKEDIITRTLSGDRDNFEVCQAQYRCVEMIETKIANLDY